MKFCIMTHIRYLEHNSYSKSEFLKKKIQDGGRGRLTKLVNEMSQQLFH